MAGTEIEKQLADLALHLKSLAFQLSRSESIVSGVRQAFSDSEILNRQAFEQIVKDSQETNSQHPAVLEAERKISLAMTGVAVIAE